MFCWFVRNGQHVRVEVVEPTPKNYELRFVDADGAEHVELFSDTGALTTRQEQVQQMLQSQGWTGPHGWVI
jgi:hypothetical protein